MQQKRCSKCNVEKPLNCFYSRVLNSDGLEGVCKSCKSDIQKKVRRTKIGVTTMIYFGEKGYAKKSSQKKVSYSLTELRLWILEQELFHELYDNWVKSGYKKGLKPSIDRKDDYKGYTIDNIQLMTWTENKQKDIEI